MRRSESVSARLLRAGLILGASALSTAAAQEAPGCRPIEGLEGLLAPGRVLLLGETHGTVEIPAFAEAVACHAVRAGLDVVVGLELPRAATGDFSAFLESEGAPSDRATLLAREPWPRGYQDGRTSRAMADLLDGLRRIKRRGGSVRVVLFDEHPPGGSQARERAMANNLAASVAASPEAMHVVLVGNLHSRTSEGNGRRLDYEPMGYLLARTLGAERLTSLRASHGGGSAWICGPDCGAIALGSSGSAEPWTIVMDEADRPSGHHGWFGVGTITASPPAIAQVGDDAGLASAAVPDPAPPAPSAKAPEEFPAQTPELLQPFQGSWHAYQYGSKAWAIDFDGERFRGVLGPDDWYEGTIRVRRDRDPMQVDFNIEDCRCGYRGMTSEAIFHDAGDSILLAAPRPGSPRPDRFSRTDGRTVELRKVAPSGDDAER